MTVNQIERDVREGFLDSARNFQRLANDVSRIVDVAEELSQRLRSGGKILLCGNGGSAADAQHLAAELMGRFLQERTALPAIALNANSSTVSAIANDYSYDEVFARQVRGLGRQGDVLIAISTSGNSANVLRAMEEARSLGVVTVGLTGERACRMDDWADFAIKVPSVSTPRIQEMHIAVGHMICELIERSFIE